MISFNKVKQRKMKMESSTTSVYRPNIKNITSPITMNIMETFLNSINNSEDINYFGTKIFDIYETFVHDNSNHPNYVKKITDVINENVLPQYKDLQSLKNYIGNSKVLGVFKESIDDFIYCDRIIKNDRVINKRFDTRNFIESKYTKLDMDEMVRSLCEFIDTYDISTEAKYHLALENITFMLKSKDKTLDESVIQNNITDYFLMRESVMTDTYIRKLQKVAIDSPLVNESVLNPYLFSKGHYYGDRIQNILEYDLSTLNSEKKVSEQIYTWLDEMCIGDTEANQRKLDCILALPLAINVSESFINGQLVNYLSIHENSIFTSQIKESLNQYKDGLSSINFLNEIKNDKGEEVPKKCPKCGGEIKIFIQGEPVYLCQDCKKYFGTVPFPSSKKSVKESTNLLESKLEKTDLDKAIKQFKVEQRKDSKAFQRVLNALYAKTPNEIINEFPHVLGLVRVAFIFAPISIPVVGPVLTLLNACVDKILSYHVNVKQSEKLFKYLRDEKTKVEDKLEKIDDEEKKKKAESYIKELEDCMKNVKKYASDELPKEIEDDSDDMDDISFDDFDFDMELESYQIKETTKEIPSVFTESTYEEDDISFLADISLYEQSLENILNNKDRVNGMILRNIDVMAENLKYFAPIIANCPTVIDYRVFSEAVKDYMYDPTSMDNVNVDSILSKALENRFISDNFLNTVIESESIYALDQIVTEGFDLNNVKLAFQALKKKMKDLNTKQKSICQSLDATGHQLINSIEKAIREDRREAVIKGSIIPSFSKCIKLGIALGGVTAINPVAGLITAVGYFGASKVLTQREKQLVYDEIATELQVVEKQLQIAENDGDMNQYRFLLNYQKKLARERQRIRYGLKVSGRRIPDAVGPKRD